MYFYVTFDGEGLSDIPLQAALAELSLCLLAKKGEIERVTNGVRKQSPRGIPFETTSAHFTTDEMCFSEFLKYLFTKREEIFACGVDDVTVWDIQDREKNDQLNGEISSADIECLAALKAAYCWTINLTDEGDVNG